MSYPDTGNSNDSSEPQMEGLDIAILVAVSLWLGAICSITCFALLGSVGLFIGLGIVLIGGLVVWRLSTDPVAWELVKWRSSLAKKGAVMDVFRNPSGVPAVRAPVGGGTVPAGAGVPVSEQLARQLSGLSDIGQLGRAVTRQMSDNFVFAYFRALSDLEMIERLHRTAPPLSPEIQEQLEEQVRYHLQQLGETSAIVNQALLEQLESYYREQNAQDVRGYYFR